MNTLPEELVVLILKNLDYTVDIVNFSMSNKRNNQIIKRNKEEFRKSINRYSVHYRVLDNISNSSKIIGTIDVHSSDFTVVKHYLPIIHKLKISFYGDNIDISDIGNTAVHLNELDLKNCNVIGDFSSLSKLNLSSLILSRCDNVTDESLRDIAKIRSLKYLDVSRTQITTETLKEIVTNIPSLKYLDVSVTLILNLNMLVSHPLEVLNISFCRLISKVPDIEVDTLITHNYQFVSISKNAKIKCLKN